MTVSSKPQHKKLKAKAQIQQSKYARGTKERWLEKTREAQIHRSQHTRGTKGRWLVKTREENVGLDIDDGESSFRPKREQFAVQKSKID